MFGRSCFKRFLGNQFLTRASSWNTHKHAVVLMYHDLREDTDFENWLRVGCSNFQLQMRTIKKLGKVLTPQEFTDKNCWDSNRLNFLVTFDDGYINNLRLALPILTAEQVPGLFFISTENMVEQNGFYADVVVSCIQVNNLSFLDFSDCGLGIFHFSQNNPIHRWDDIQKLLTALKVLRYEESGCWRRVMGDLESRFIDTLAKALPRFRPLTSMEVKKIAQSEYGFIGSHSHSHHLMTNLDSSEILMNLNKSKTILENLVQGPVDHFAYPNGDSNSTVKHLVGKAGFKWAYTVKEGLVEGDGITNLAIPRIGVGGYDRIADVFFQINRELIGSKSILKHKIAIKG